MLCILFFLFPIPCAACFCITLRTADGLWFLCTYFPKCVFCLLSSLTVCVCLCIFWVCLCVCVFLLIFWLVRANEKGFLHGPLVRFPPILWALLFLIIFPDPAPVYVCILYVRVCVCARWLFETAWAIAAKIFMTSGTKEPNRPAPYRTIFQYLCMGPKTKKKL